MFANRKWQQAALVLNLLGTLALFLSFQATSSEFRILTEKSQYFPGEAMYSLCVNNFALLRTNGKNGTAIASSTPCDSSKAARPIAVVTIEHGWLVWSGFLLMLFGFALQFFALPQPETIDSLRRDLKKLKLKKRLQPKDR